MKQKKWYTLVPVIALIVMLAVPQTASAISEDAVKAVLQTMNDQLAAAGEDFRIAYVDFHTHDKVGITVYANDRQHQLDDHWLPYDPSRFGAQDIYWAIDKYDQPSNVEWIDAEAAIGRAMNTWDTVPCAYIPLTLVDDRGLDLGYVQFLAGMGGVDGWLADITHAGWLPAAFFDIVFGDGGGDEILGGTFTFTWDAAPDVVAFREIYMNDHFPWQIDAHYDIETAILHEVGHGLSLGHFGKIFRSKKNDKLHFSPQAVMNPIYSFIQHELLGTDNASFCSIWASWPNN